MTSGKKMFANPTPVYVHLHDRFYSNGNVVIDSSASSHWKKCTQYFKVQPIDETRFDLKGYGFGTSGSNSLIERGLSFAGNALHLSYLRMPGLYRDIRTAQKVTQRMGLLFSQDAFRQVCTLNLLDHYMKLIASYPRRVLIIGDGHGIFSALFHDRYPDARIYLADLGSVLFFQAYNLQKAFPDISQSVTDDDENVNNGAVFNFCPADQLHTLPECDLDLAVNVASMQEMDPAVIIRYFSLLRQHNTQLFYCCNRVEKRLEGGEITRIKDYPWLPSDDHLVDEPCPWHQWFLGFGSSPPVRLRGFPVPFMHRYDGIHWHRLTKLKGESIHG